MYWSSNKIEAQQSKYELVTPFDVDAIKQGSYELCLGPQGAVSCDGTNRPTDLEPREVLCIPGGQFGLLLTEEIVAIPANTIAFISLKTKIKSQGLVNVSGFHVDPGFKGRLKFWVYNAGNQDIRILRGDRTFLIWFADLDQATRDPYPNRNPAEQNEITAEDLRRLQGRLSSPAALEKQISEFEHKVQKVEWINNTVLVLVIGLALALAAPLFERLVDRLTKPAAQEVNIPAVATPAPLSKLSSLPPPVISPPTQTTTPTQPSK